MTDSSQCPVPATARSEDPLTRRVLIVDDLTSILALERAFLTDAGFEVLEAKDGVQALGVLSRDHVDLVVTDLNMPRMDGLQLIRAVRALPAARLTPIVVVTTESEYRRKLEGKAVGATAWIVKPFTGEQLLKIVRRLLGE